MTISNVFLTFPDEEMFKQDDTVDKTSSLPSPVHGTFSSSRPGAIEVLNYSFSINQVGSEEAGRPRSIEQITRSPLTIVKAADSRTPKLFRFCVRGEFITKAVLEVFGANPDRPYLTYTLSYVHVSNFEPAGGSALSTETIGLSYGQMEVKFDNLGIGTGAQGNGRTSGSVWSKWSWVMEMPETIGAAKLGG